MHENFFITHFYVELLGSKVAQQWKKVVNVLAVYTNNGFSFFPYFWVMIEIYKNASVS